MSEYRELAPFVAIDPFRLPHARYAQRPTVDIEQGWNARPTGILPSIRTHHSDFPLGRTPPQEGSTYGFRQHRAASVANPGWHRRGANNSWARDAFPDGVSYRQPQGYFTRHDGHYYPPFTSNPVSQGSYRAPWPTVLERTRMSHVGDSASERSRDESSSEMSDMERSSEMPISTSESPPSPRSVNAPPENRIPEQDSISLPPPHETTFPPRSSSLPLQSFSGRDEVTPSPAADHRRIYDSEEHHFGQRRHRASSPHTESSTRMSGLDLLSAPQPRIFRDRLSVISERSSEEGTSVSYTISSYSIILKPLF